MPIVILSDFFAAGVNNISDLLEIKFRAVDTVNNPIINTAVTATIRNSNIRIADQSSTTDSNGEGWVKVTRYPAIGNWGDLTIRVAGQVGGTPIVIYNPEQSPELYIDKGTYFDNRFYIDLAGLKQEGLLVQARFDNQVAPNESATFFIGAINAGRVPEVASISLNFKIPPAVLNLHVALPGEYPLFYSHNAVSGNKYVPYVTTLVVLGDEATTRLLPLALETQEAGYINVIDNLLGFNGVIPGNQPYIEVGDQWQVVYSLIDPSTNDTDFIPVANGTVSSTAETVFSIPAGFFPEERDVSAWFWYAITKPLGRQYVSLISRFILDTK